MYEVELIHRLKEKHSLFTSAFLVQLSLDSHQIDNKSINYLNYFPSRFYLNSCARLNRTEIYTLSVILKTKSYILLFITILWFDR